MPTCAHHLGRLTAALMMCIVLQLCCLPVPVTDATCACSAHRGVLLDLYTATSGDTSWTEKWDASDSDAPCGWYGITCSNNTGGITSIVLSSAGLNGTLPSSLSALGSDLQRFSVPFNLLRGTLPESYRSWTGLLNFTVLHNSLNGTLPSAYAAWRQLQYFRVSTNNISGTLPPEYGEAWAANLLLFDAYSNIDLNGTLPHEFAQWRKMNTFSTADTALHGTIPSVYSQWGALFNVLDVGSSNRTGQLTGTLSPTFANWTGLVHVNLYGNRFNGTLPDAFGEGWTEVDTFGASNNNFSGTLPSSYGNWLKVNSFTASNNELSGTLPSSYGQFRNISILQLDGNMLTGTLPDTLANWSVVEQVDVSRNQLSGTLPLSFGTGWKNSISKLYMNDNKFSGSLPDTWAQWGSQISVLYASKNSLSGSLPSSYASWTKITSFQVASNNLSGTLPSAYSAWTSYITSLLLHNNKLTGTLPASWGNALSSLTFFFVSQNQLEGTIPASFFQHSTVFFGFGSNNFSGTLPPTTNAVTLTSPAYLELQNNAELEGAFPTFIGVIGSCGTLLCGTLNAFSYYVCLPSDVSAADLTATYARAELLTAFQQYVYSPETACIVRSPAPTAHSPTPNSSRNSTMAPATVSPTVAASTAAVAYVSITGSASASIGASVRGSVPSLQRAATVLALSARCRQSQASGNTSSSSSGGSNVADPAFNTALDNPLLLTLPVDDNDESMEYGTGAAVGNTVLVIAAALLSQVVGAIVLPLFTGVARWPLLGKAVAFVLPSVLLPGSVMLLFTAVMQPTISSAVFIIANSSGRNTASISTGVAVLLLWLATSAWFVVRIVCGLRTGRECMSNKDRRKREAVSASASSDPLCYFTSAPTDAKRKHVPLGAAQKNAKRQRTSSALRRARRSVRRFWMSLFGPVEEWTLHTDMEFKEKSVSEWRGTNNLHDDEVICVVRKSLGVVIEPYVGRRAWYFAVEWSVSLASGVTSGVALAVAGSSDSTSSAVCAAAEWGGWVALALTVADVGLCLALRPLSVRADFATTVTTGVLGVVAAALALAGDDDSAQAVVVAAAILQLVLMVLLTFGEVFIMERHRRTGASFQPYAPIDVLSLRKPRTSGDDLGQRRLAGGVSTGSTDVHFPEKGASQHPEASQPKSFSSIGNLTRLVEMACALKSAPLSTTTGAGPPTTPK